MSKFSLIETFGWNERDGFVRMERHLLRLQQSAEQLEFKFDKERILATLKIEHSRAFHFTEGLKSFRIRLQLSKTGEADIRCVAFEPIPSSKIYRLAIAATTLSSSNPLLRHKTTERNSYQTARSEFAPEKIDEVILLNENEELCEGTITNLFVRKEASGELLTPALNCGLLPGVLRAELLELQQAREAILTMPDLVNAHEIFVGNSLRGLVRAQLVDR